MLVERRGGIVQGPPDCCCCCPPEEGSADVGAGRAGEGRGGLGDPAADAAWAGRYAPGSENGIWPVVFQACEEVPDPSDL